MELADLVDVQVVQGTNVGMKTTDNVVKLTFRKSGKEEEIVLFPPLFCHALGLTDDGLDKVMTNKEQLLENARTNERLATVLKSFFAPPKKKDL